MRRICPACSTRTQQVIDPACIICHGQGHITLGAAALAIYEADVVAEAVAITLEAAAREADLALSLSDDKVAPVVDALAVMAAAGIIQHAPALPGHGATVTNIKTAPSRRRTPRPLTAGEQLCFDFTGLWPEPQDRRVIAAANHIYSEHDRPHARGLPTMSAAGHPSHLARILDPAEPGTNTRAEARTRRHNHQHAQALIEAGHTAAKRRTRKKAATAA